jgi:hypothetical protein
MVFRCRGRSFRTRDRRVTKPDTVSEKVYGPLKYYHTEIDGHNLKFYQNKISNRWWVEYVSDDSIVKIEKDIIPCSENDYKLSQNSIISERIIKRLKNKII